MEKITSKSNEKVKFLKSLNEKKFRHLNNSFYLEGIKVIDEVLELSKAINIKFIAYSKDLLINVNGGNKILEKIEVLNNNKSIETYEFSDDIFKYITDTVNPQGIIAVIEIPKYNESDIIDEIEKNDKSNILILDKVQDLGNLGTIIRTADAFNVKTILCTEGTADVYSPKVVRSTMGSILREKIIYISSNNDKIIDDMKRKGIKLVGTSLNAKKYISEFEFNDRYAFVVGNEANGVSDEILKKCDNLVKIEMADSAESLNVGIATGILLYHQYKK